MEFISLIIIFIKKKLYPETLLKSQKLSKVLAKELRIKICNSPFLSNEIKNKNYFEIFLQREIEIINLNYFYYFESAVEFLNKQINYNKSYFFIDKNYMSQRIIKNYKNFYIFNLFFLNKIKILREDFIKIFENLKFILNSFFLKKSISQKNISTNLEKNSKNIQNIFFLNCGVFEHGNSQNYFFYQDNKFKNFFKTSNTVMVEVNGSHKFTNKDIKFFKSKNIVYYYIKDLFGLINKLIFFKYAKLFIITLFKYDFTIAQLIVKYNYQILKFDAKLSNFKDLKYAFIAYEYLFPITLAIACKMRNIKLVGIQRRMHLPLQTHYLLLDYYFIISPILKDYLKNYKLAKIKLFPVGNIINLYCKKQKIKNKSKFKCIVFDMKSQTDWYNDSISQSSNWKINNDFYELILKLSKKFTQINFYIKSKKKQSWLDLVYFRNFKKELKKTKNLFLLKNNQDINSYTMIMDYDFAIGKHSSILDEFLVCQKPSIIYENPKLVSPFLNYGKKIFSYSEKDLFKKINKITKNIVKYNKDLDKSRKKLFYKFVKKNYFTYLNQIYNESNKVLEK